jgi:phosphatidylinositol glycan class B
MDTRLFHKRVLILAFFVFSLTASFSKGFHHFDEHFQIFEFAGLKLGLNDASNLPWEYDAQIRSAFQPAIVVVMVKIMKAVGITSPFDWAFIVRLLAGFFSLVCIYFCCSALSRHLLPENRKLFILLSYFLYFIPYIAVRFSSETLGSCFFILGFSLLLSVSYKQQVGSLSLWLAVGLLWGLSFICRFQCGIMIAGGLVWLLFIYKLPISRLLTIVSGILVIVGIGILIDHWFYGQWVFSAYNYFQTNILHDEAMKFGDSPWYFYLSELYKGDTKSAIKLIVLLGAIHYIYRNPKDIITFIVIPFVLIHLLIGHKEMRFMIPVAFFAPYITVVFWQFFTQRYTSEWSGQIRRLVVYQALFINMLSMLVNVFKPADGQPLVYEYLYQRYGNAPHNIYYLQKGNNFFWTQALLPMNFYNPSKSTLNRIDAPGILKLSANADSSKSVLIAERKLDLSNLPLKALYIVRPQWLQTLDLNDWMKIKNDDWVVYQILPPKPIKLNDHTIHHGPSI